MSDPLIHYAIEYDLFIICDDGSGALDTAILTREPAEVTCPECLEYLNNGGT